MLFHLHILDEPSKTSRMKSEPINDDVETRYLSMDEALDN